MMYKEVECDLFSVDSSYYLVHCISADFALGAGIAKEFEKRYHLREDLLLAFGDKWYLDYDDKLPGDAFLHKEKKVIDLITKTRYWHKPTMYSLGRALKKMKNGCEKLGINKIAMPKIGCGLDRLKWNEVSELIKDVFSDTDVEILVCYK